MVKYLAMLSEYYYFQKRGPDDLASGKCVGKTFKQYVLENHSDQFYRDLLLPMLSVICTCSWEAVGNYPAEVIVDYMAGRARDHPLGSTTLRATSGTTETVKRLSASFDRALTGCHVVKVVPGGKVSSNGESDSSLPTVTWRQNGGPEVTESFDQVVIATQANAALKLLEATPEHVKALSSVKYEKSRTLLHTDESMVAKGFGGTCSLTVRENESDCTIWMNRIDPLLGNELQKNVFQTWNPLQEPKATPVVDVIFERPIMTMDSMQSLDLLAEINGRDGVWFIGAYSLYSMPLLENGARSAIRVANRMLKNKYPELGVQISGESFAQRRPDLVDPETASRSLTRRKSRAAIAVDGIVLSSYLAVILGAASLVAMPLMRSLNRSSG
jgi:predicted NAD/FAD-binding protein